MTFEEFQKIVNNNFSEYGMDCSERVACVGFFSQGASDRWMIEVDYNALREIWSIDVFVGDSEDRSTLWFCESKYLHTLLISFSAIKNILTP